MNDLETLLEPLVESAPEPAPVAEVRARAMRIRRRRRVRAGALAVLVVVAVVAGIDAALPSQGHDVRTIAPPSTTAAPRRVHVGAPRPFDQVGPMDMMAAYGSVWLSQGDRVARIDATDGRVIAAIPVPGESDFRNLAAGAGSMWVDDTGTGNVTRIDPATNRVVATIPLLHDDFDPHGMAFFDGYLWVARPQPMGLYGDIVAIDPATNRVARRSDQVATPRTFGVIAGSDALWSVGGGAGYELERFDTRTLRTRVTRRDVMAIVGVSPGRLWLQTARGVIETDERSGVQIGRAIVPPAGPVNVTVAVADGIVWVASQPDSSTAGSMTPFDAATHTVVGAPTTLGLPIMKLVPTAGAVWASVYRQQGLTRVPYTR
jgi:streptogramin lyase